MIPVVASVHAVDIGTHVPASERQYTGSPIDPPDNMPHVWDELWHGRSRPRVEHFTEYRIWRDRGLRLRIRATASGRLIGIYAAETTGKGTRKPPAHEDVDLAAQLAKWMTGSESIHDVEPLVEPVLRYVKDVGLPTGTQITLVHEKRNGISSTPALYHVVYEGLMSLAYLVYADSHGGPTRLVKRSKPGPFGQQIIVGQISAEHLLATGSKSFLPWWLDMGEDDRKGLAQHIRSAAGAIIDQPPSWTWWQAWVVRNQYTLWYEPLGVRAWAPGLRCSIRAAANKYLRPQRNSPPPATAVQGSLFDTTADREMP